MKRPCETQCPQCPFRSTSASGWLGGYETPGNVLNALWHDSPFFCHTRADYERSDWEEVLLRNGELCLGGLLCREDWPCPASDDPEVAAAQDWAVAMREACPERFDVMGPKEFMRHHDRSRVTEEQG